MSQHILAIDQGTTGTTCLLVRFRDDGRIAVVGRGYAELLQHFPQPGWVEHDLDAIWTTVLQSIQQALAGVRLKAGALAGIGITNQRETTGIWRPDGSPLHRALVWQDRRTAAACEALRGAGHAALVRARTGLVIDPYFSGTKLAWLLQHVPDARQLANRGELRFGTIDTWLVHCLTGGAHITDVSNAARTMLFDIDRLAWDETLCALLGDIPGSLLPRVCSNAEIYGHTRNVPGLPDGIPVAGMAGDQHAALFGQACLEPGMAKCTYGTGAFVLVNTGSQRLESHNDLLTTVAWKLGETVHYALEGSIFVAGAAVQWLRDGLGIIRSSDEVEALAAQVPDAQGVVFVPALTGLGAPHWRPEARGLLHGLTRGTSRAHIARATLEGIGLQVHDLLIAMREDLGAPVRVLRVDGAAAANNLLMQFQADLLGLELHRPVNVETTAVGAALLAALGSGLRTDVGEISRSWQLERCFTSGRDAAWRDVQVERWRQAVDRA